MNLITPSSGLLFWMVLIFAIVFFVLAKFGFPAITSSIKKRQDRIAQSLRDAKLTEERLAQIQLSCDKMLEETREQQSQLIAQARKAADGIVEEAKLKARAEADRIAAQARLDIEAQKQEAVQDLRALVARVGVLVSEKILREKLSTDDARMALVEKMVDEVRKDNLS